MDTTDQRAWHLASDDPCSDGEESVDVDTLNQDLEDLLTNSLQVGGDKKTRTTWVLSDGRRVGPEWVPQRLMRARKAWLDSARDPDLFWILAGLLQWAGRGPTDPEELEQLQHLRERAEALLGATLAA
jgi:hypothetical protein